MAKLIFAMTQSLDGYVATVDGALEPPLAPPDDALFRHFVDFERTLGGVVYGRRIYEIMRYWEQDRPDWRPQEHDFAAAWRAHPIWVVSRTLKTVGPNATLVTGDVEPFVRDLKEKAERDLGVAGPDLASSLTKMGLVDEYHLYFRPVVLGRGKPYFAGARPPLHLAAVDRAGDDAVRIIYRS